MHSWLSTNRNDPPITLGSIPVDVFKAAVFMEGEKMDANLREEIKKLAWIKAKHRFPSDPEKQQKCAEKWITERTKILDAHKLNASDYFSKK